MADRLNAANIASHRGYLLRYAYARLRDRCAAEDAVQDTLLGAIEGASRYAGRSSVRTWLTGILKHKIVDQMRRQFHEHLPLPIDGEGDEGESAAADPWYSVEGRARQLAANWGDPVSAFESKAFAEVLGRCTQSMPANTARAFILRELMSKSTREICMDLNISEANCWTMLHRARSALRARITVEWFGKP
jgi:RNA polymerase sigma-70 factor (ECF subfamily)